MVSVGLGVKPRDCILPLRTCKIGLWTAISSSMFSTSLAALNFSNVFSQEVKRNEIEHWQSPVEVRVDTARAEKLTFRWTLSAMSIAPHTKFFCLGFSSLNCGLESLDIPCSLAEIRKIADFFHQRIAGRAQRYNSAARLNCDLFNSPLLERTLKKIIAPRLKFWKIPDWLP